jgi:peptidoglycan/LPS O-acetylase OafA/YrhL
MNSSEINDDEPVPAPAPAPNALAVSFLPESQLQEDSAHSVLISLLRGAAAIQVAAAHLRSEFFPGLRTLDEPVLWYQALAFFTGFAHQAVVVFFLISGWLVGGSLLNKLGRPDALKLYAIDRVTRLWTVLAPTFVMMLALAIVTDQIHPSAVDFSPTNPYSATTLAGNLLGLQTISVPQFGGNYPLWSLANETWYYVLFPLVVLLWTARAWTARIVPVAALLAVVAWLPLTMLLYFSIWLLGAGFSRVRIHCSGRCKLLLLILLITVAVYFRLTGLNDDQNSRSFPQDLMFSLPFLLLLSACVGKLDPQRRWIWRVKAVATWFSNFSFTLYVVHVPVLALMAYVGTAFFGRAQLEPQQLAHLGVYVAMLLFVLAFAYGFYRLFEARTHTLRSLVKQAVLGTTVRAQPAA